MRSRWCSSSNAGKLLRCEPACARGRRVEEWVRRRDVSKLSESKAVEGTFLVSLYGQWVRNGRKSSKFGHLKPSLCATPDLILPQRTQRRATMANDELTGGSGAGALREDMISNAVAFLKHPQVSIRKRARRSRRDHRPPLAPREPTSKRDLTHRPIPPLNTGDVQPGVPEEAVPGEERPDRGGDRRGVQARAAAHNRGRDDPRDDSPDHHHPRRSARRGVPGEQRRASVDTGGVAHRDGDRRAGHAHRPVQTRRRIRIRRRVTR